MDRTTDRQYSEDTMEAIRRIKRLEQRLWGDRYSVSCDAERFTVDDERNEEDEE
jgi:hypothetical protein